MEIKKLKKSNLNEILELEKKAFIPLIRTSQENILKRLNNNHVYLGAFIDEKIIGTLALRFAEFNPNFEDFCKKYPNFEKYAEQDNVSNANAIFVYSLGIDPRYRNGIWAKRLIEKAKQVGIKKTWNT